MLKSTMWTALALVGLVLVACSKKEEAAQPSTPPAAEIKAAPVQAFAYVTHIDGPVTIYSVGDYTKVGEIDVVQGGRGMGLSEDGKLMMVAVKNTSDMAIVDLETRQVIRRVPVGIDTEGIEFSDDGKHMIVTNQADENVSVYDIETGDVIKRIDTRDYGNRPHGVKRSPEGKHFAVTLAYGNKLLILDHEYKVVNEVPTGEIPQGVTYSRDGSEIFLVLARGKAIQVFNAETLGLIREMPVGDRCANLSLTPDDSQLVVVCGSSKEIKVLNAQTGELVKTITGGKMPWGVIISPKSRGSLNMPG